MPLLLTAAGVAVALRMSFERSSVGPPRAAQVSRKPSVGRGSRAAGGAQTNGTPYERVCVRSGAVMNER